MLRFLTPARICLLVLIQLYLQSDQVSAESSLDFLDYIARQVVVGADADEEHFKERQDLALSDARAHSRRLQSLSSRQPGRNLYDVLLQSLWELDSLDTLLALIHSLREALPEDEGSTSAGLQITPASPLGQFIRRFFIEFTRLRFAESQVLWKAFQRYRSITFQDWAAKNPEAATRLTAGDPSKDIVPPIGAPDGGLMSNSASMSSIDASMLLDFAMHRLQKLGTRVPSDVKTELEKWIGHQYEAGGESLHLFVAFFEHWRAGAYTMALESLHRYFDYAVANVEKNNSANVRVYYQYALLHLSMLHADFECWEESIEAMNECIVSARETNDSACLHFALSWLLYLRRAHAVSDDSSLGSMSRVVVSGGTEVDEMTFLKAKAREARNWALLSSTLLEEAKYIMANGGNITRAQELVLQASYLNVQHNLTTVISIASATRGVSLERLGQVHLARRTYEVVDCVLAKHCPWNDKTHLACRLALGMARAGLYSNALSILNQVSPAIKGVLKLERRIQAFVSLVQLERQIHRGNIDAASYHLTDLKPLYSLNDPNLDPEIRLLEIELLLKQKEYQEALKKVDDRLTSESGPGRDFAHRLWLLVLKSRILAIGGQPSRGFSLALRATSTAHRHHLVPVLFEGLLVLGRILIDLSEYNAAGEMLNSLLPHVLESHDVYLQARLLVAAGEAHVGAAGHSCESGSNEQVRHMRTAEDLIERGRAAFERVEDRDGMLDCLVMKSRIAGWAGDEQSAQRAEEMYAQVLSDMNSVDTMVD